MLARILIFIDFIIVQCSKGQDARQDENHSIELTALLACAVFWGIRKQVLLGRESRFYHPSCESMCSAPGQASTLPNYQFIK